MISQRRKLEWKKWTTHLASFLVRNEIRRKNYEDLDIRSDLNDLLFILYLYVVAVVIFLHLLDPFQSAYGINKVFQKFG
jgi:hypothetical protein